MKEQEKEFYIFDLDGVLVETMYNYGKAFARVFQEDYGVENFDLDYYVHELGGMDGYGQISILAKRYGVTVEDYDALNQKMHEYYVETLDHIVPIDHNVRLARALLDAGKKVAVASGSYRFIVDRCLEAAGLSDIPIKVTASEVKKCKPDPEGYLRAAELLGADPKDCLVFEDTPVGVKAAQAAGMRVFRFYDTLRDGPNI